MCFSLFPAHAGVILEAAARLDSWSEWMRTDWVRALRDADPDELEVAE